MLLGLTIAGLLVALWFAAALVPIVRHGISLRQGLLYAPLQLLYGIDDRQIAIARKCKTPVIYTIVHRSKLDAALMLSLLPDTTLHILDGRSAGAAWLEPYRAIAPTIAFNAEHVFVSRRLVRRLKGGGRLAVYLPDQVEPGSKSFRLYRALARIESQANARIVPIDLAGARHLPFSNSPPEQAPRRYFPCLRLRVLEGMTISELVERAGENRTTRAHALFDRIAELRIAAANPQRSLFRALSAAARLNGPRRVIIEGPRSGARSYRQLFTEARILGRHVQGKTVSVHEPVGMLVPNSGAMVTAFLAIQSAGRPAALIDPARPAEETIAYLVTAGVRVVIASRTILGETGFTELANALEESGLRLIWLDEILASAGGFSRFAARLGWRFALQRRAPGDPALVIARHSADDAPEALVLSQRNVLTNVLQLQTRIEISPADTVMNLLPGHDCAGLAGGALLALMAGARLHFPPRTGQGDAPAMAASGIRPTLLFALEAQLAGLAASDRSDLTQLRSVLAIDGPIREATRTAFRERHGVEIMAAYSVGEAAPIVAFNTATHARGGTVGRLLPSMQIRLAPAEAVAGASRLWLRGPSLPSWIIRADRPGQLLPLDEWHDTRDLVSIDREGFLTLHRPSISSDTAENGTHLPAA